MIWWIIIGALILIFLITSFIKLEHDFKAIKAIILIVVLLLIAGSVYGWIKSDNSDMSSPKGVVGSVYSYFVWLGDAGLKIFDATKSSISTVGNTINSNVTKSSGDGRK
jgi:glucan phosphoethanolaminetransferase (alkaline phosphatase superfamily)